MASIFDTGDAPCGVFAEIDGNNTTRTIDFTRGIRSQNSAGEIEVLWRPAVTVTCDAQPMPAGLRREVHGQVFEVKWRLFQTGLTPIKDGDRTYLDGYQLEVTQISQYGSMSAEIDLGYIGR